MRMLDWETFRLVSNHVVEECQKRGVDGVFAMSTTHPGNWDIYHRRILRESPLDNASDGEKYNLLAIALAKLSAVMTHAEVSGEVKYIGEVPYKGGLRSSTGVTYAFSGAAQEIDDEIVRDAERFHFTL